MMEVQATPRRGRPPRASRESIIEVARSIAPDRLTMQAIADGLGVDRATVNYHFTDRDELFSIVASMEFSAAMAKYKHPASDDWRVWVTSYARAVRKALHKQPEFVNYVRLSAVGDAAAFHTSEQLIQKLLSAGFSERTVMQTLAFLSETVHAAVRSELQVASGGHPQGPELERFLAGQPSDALPGMRRLMKLDPLAKGRHFEFALKLIVAGLEQMLGR